MPPLWTHSCPNHRRRYAGLVRKVPGKRVGPAGQPGSAKFGQANVCLLLSPRRGGACTERRRMPSLARRSNGPQSRLAEGSCVEYPHRKDVILSEVIDRNVVDNEVEGSRVRGTSNGASGVLPVQVCPGGTLRRQRWHERARDPSTGKPFASEWRSVLRRTSWRKGRN